MAQILKKASKYKRISTVLSEGEAHLRDPLTPPPQILKPPALRKDKKPDDITDFPKQHIVPLPEAIPYREGKYRPSSVPLIQGYYPYNIYLQQGKVYSWCSCGISQNSPWCDQLCNWLVTRNRPVVFNVSESGYFKICQCKHSANAPFCNGTHRQVLKYHYSTHRGFYEWWGQVGFYAGWAYIFWNFYS
mmetsp:Transcript_62094/g.72210  ORF Transcript_62094/g.72210 Transcript_62094/m.72210 type:complete len:189 (+) Transcript_62094:27-593(+)